MTSSTTHGASSPAAIKPPTVRRFELPALNLQFGSLTEGTNIPPPLPSPILEEPAAQNSATPSKTSNSAPIGLQDGTNSAPAPTGAGKRSTDVAMPLSPTGSSGRSSLRRYLSKSLLNASYEEQASSKPANGQVTSRPPSRTASVMDDKKARRGSGWFRRLTSSDGSNKRNSQVFQESQTTQQPAQTGPPPPKIPELDQWKSKVDTSLGDDLFKSIR